MNRRLVLLNLVLVALVGATGWQLRKNWLEARQREGVLLAQKVTPTPAPPVAAPQPVPPVEAASYVVVAEKMLFAKDRNPDVVIEAKPEKPVPPFPQAYGVIDLGAGATAILSEKAGGDQKSYRAGDKVGSFQIASLSTTGIVLEWEGKTFEKTIAELRPKEIVPEPGAVAPQSQSGRIAIAGEGGPRPNTQTPQKVVEEAQKPKDGGPGLDISSPTMRACVPGENSPAGTVVGGWRKFVSQTPFGRSCRWELVGK